jgi:hypothetical protein
LSVNLVNKRAEYYKKGAGEERLLRNVAKIKSEIFPRAGINSNFLAFALSFAIHGVHSNFLVIFLERGQILAGLTELALLHTFTDIPVDKRPFGIHQVKLVIETSPRLGNGSRVGQHADGTLDLGQISTGNNGRWLVIDANLKARKKSNP